VLNFREEARGCLQLAQAETHRPCAAGAVYERARALFAELRGAHPALDPSDIMGAQMLLELAIGEVEADAQRDQPALRTMDAPLTVGRPTPSPTANQKRSLTRLCARFFRRTGDSIKDLREAKYCEGPSPDRSGGVRGETVRRSFARRRRNRRRLSRFLRGP
jgi:hypothetical protein